MKLAKESIVRWGAHWHNLANTIEAPMCCGDAAFLSNYFDHLFNSGFNHIFGTVFKFGVQIDTDDYQHAR